jgi:cellulose 1,4-beta-cellobiosidase
MSRSIFLALFLGGLAGLAPACSSTHGHGSDALSVAGSGGLGGGDQSGSFSGASGGSSGTGNGHDLGGSGWGGGGSGSAGSGDAAGGNGGGGANAAGNGGGDTARVDNPFADVKGYVNPDWSNAAKGEPGGERVASFPTAVWLDRIAALADLPKHLDAALQQNAGYIELVIYDLPGRDCAALASNGELKPDELPRYESEFIDPIVSTLSDPKYRGLRIVNVIEVDSLPNLITNTNLAACATMKSNNAYVDGVAYALQKLGALPNVYNYVDAGHHAWLGWDSNFGPTAELFLQVAQKAGMDTIAGFITNSSNYSALVEPYFTPDTMVGGQPAKASKWMSYNPYADELSFAKALRQKLISLGFPESIGMLIDTSRNGWGGSKRPTQASTSTSLDTFVDESRIDRRIHAGNWCNQSGAGLGERPRANPEPGIDAYVWIKPPGESDGASMEIQNSEGKGFDRMCDPTYGGNGLNGNSATGAMPNAPLAGKWFSAQFRALMDNAYPPL